MPDILYIFDDGVSGTRLPNSVRPDQKIWLCPITTDEKRINSIEKRIKDQINCRAERVPYIKMFNERSFALKKEFLKFISEFAAKPVFNGKNIKEYFKSDKDFSLWWTSLVAEKNPLKTNSYSDFVTLLVILEAAKQYNCSRIWCDLRNKELINDIGKNTKDVIKVKNIKPCFILPEAVYCCLHLLKGSWRLSVISFKSFYAKLIMPNFSARQNILKNSNYVLITYFPFFEKEGLNQYRFINKFYKPLQESLEKKYKGKLSWIAITVDNDGYGFRKSVALGKKINRKNNNYFFCEEYISILDFLSLRAKFIFNAVRFITQIPKIKENFKFSQENVSIWTIFRKDLYSSFCGTRLTEGLCYYDSFKKAFKYPTKDTTVIYCAEMQGWEKALNSAACWNKKVKVIGIQHTIVSVLHLMYFDDSEDLKDGDCVERMPKPDRLACVGKIPLRLFRESGWSEKRTFALGSLRLQHLKKNIENKIPWTEKTKDIVVATAISRDEARALVNYAYQAFGVSSRYKVFIKEHPYCPVRPLLGSVNGKLDNNIFKFVNTSLEELLPQAKILIVAESSAAVEGISCQCKVIIPRLAGLIDMSPLSGLSDLPVYVNSSEELRKAALDILDKEDTEAGYYQRCRNFIEEYYDFPEGEDSFLNRIETQIKC